MRQASRAVSKSSDDTASVDKGSTNENFELWIRMATDNKINSTNSWNFALIDYFHDMSVFREGDSINFQKASTTLDGCVKIYSSRIDSAATETGRLLSGLSGAENGQSEPQEDEDEEGVEYSDEESRRKALQRKARRQRTRKTLLSNFDQLRAKDMDRELLANPIFKKALSDFDEGGSKSLLMNMLRMSKDGRVMFVVTEKSGDAILNGDDNEPTETESNPTSKEVTFCETPIDVKQLQRFVTDLPSDAKVCPSLEPLESVTAGDTTATHILDQLGQIECQEPEQQLDDYGDYGESNTSKNRSQYSLYLDEGMDDPDDSWRSLNLTRLFDEHAGSTVENEADEEGGIEMAQYFDQLSNKNWRGPEYWKISGVKSQYTKNGGEEAPAEPTAKNNGDSEPVIRHTKKHTTAIDFMDDANDLPEDDLFKVGDPAKMSMPQKLLQESTGYCLPEDLQFTTQRLVCLNLKPEQQINTILTKRKKRLAAVSRDEHNMVADESFFADIYENNEQPANFFEDNAEAQTNEPEDFDGGDAPANDIDEYETPIQPLSQQAKSRNGITYARTSKKVDIRLLKQHLWDTLEEKVHRKRDSSYLEDDKENVSAVKEVPMETEMRFSEVVSNMSQKYEGTAKAELSTSYCFICMLHLANENGFMLDNTTDNADLIIHS